MAHRTILSVSAFVFVLGGCGSNHGSSSSGSGGGGGSGDTSSESATTTSGATTSTTASASSSSSGMITNCGALPPVGEWQDITPPVFHQPSNMQANVLAINPQDQSVFASATNKTNGGDGSTGLYKSTDCGQTFTLVSTGENASVLQDSSPWSIAIDPQNPATMYLGAGYGGLTIFKSTNGGVDWTPLKPDADDVLDLHNNFVQAIALDQADPKHLVVTFHDNCTSKYNANCMSQTHDGGATWQEFSGPAELTSWQEGSSISILGKDKYFYAAAGSYKGYYTDDAGKTWTKVLDGPLYATYVPSVHIGPDGTAYVAMLNTGVFYSKDLGASWTLIAGSTSSSAVTDDGVNLYASSGWDHGGAPFYETPLDGIMDKAPVWTHVTTPMPISVGSSMFAYDAAHHLLYSVNQEAGVWRLRTQ